MDRKWQVHIYMGFLGGPDSEESAWSAGDPGLIPELGRSPEEGNGNPLQCSCLKNPMDRGAWWAPVHGVTELNRTERLALSFTYTTAETLSDCAQPHLDAPRHPCGTWRRGGTDTSVGTHAVWYTPGCGPLSSANIGKTVAGSLLS